MRVLVVAVNFDNAVEIGTFLDELARWHPIPDTVVVDDGSRDASDRIAEERGFTVLRHGVNQGVGAAIRSGIRFGQAENRWDAVAIISCNGKMKPSSLPGLIAALASADYVQGNRYIAGADSNIPPDRRIGTALFSFVGSFLLGRRFHDLTCGFRCYRLDLFTNPAIELDQPWLNRYEMEYYLHFKACRLGWRIVEAPVSIDYSHLPRRRYTKIRPFVGWWSMIRPLIRLALMERVLLPLKSRSFWRAAVLPLGILMLAAVIRAPGLSWGVGAAGNISLPHPDEGPLALLSSSLQMNDPRYDLPYTRFFPLLSGLASHIAGIAPAKPGWPFPAGPIVAGRVVSLIAGVLTVALLYGALLAATRNRRAAAFAAAFLALSPLHVMNSHFATADALATFFFTATLVYAVRTALSGRLTHALACAVLAGAAVGAKFNPAAVVAVVLAGWTLPFKSRRAQAFAWLFLSVAGILVFFAANGFNFDWRLFKAILWNIRVDNMDVKDHAKWVNPPFFLLLALIGCGLPCALFSLRAIYRRDAAPPQSWIASKIVLFPAAAAYLIVISTLSIPYSRHVLPLVPLFCLAAALGLDGFLRRHAFATPAAAALITGVFMYQFVAVLSIERYFVQDPVWAARQWLAANVGEGSRIFIPKGWKKGANTTESLLRADYAFVTERWAHRFERSQINPLGAPPCDSRLFHQNEVDCRAYWRLVDGGVFEKVKAFDITPLVPEQWIYHRLWGSYPVFPGDARIYRRVAR